MCDENSTKGEMKGTQGLVQGCRKLYNAVGSGTAERAPWVFAAETDRESSFSQRRSLVVGEGPVKGGREGRWPGGVAPREIGRCYALKTHRNGGNTHKSTFESRLQSNFILEISFSQISFVLMTIYMA